MAKKSAPEGKKYSYMDTYGDLVTLLLCFFVLLFSMSTVDTVKYNAIVEALGDRFGNNPLTLTTVTTSIVATTSEFAENPPVGEALDPEQVLPAEMNQLAEAIENFIEENNLQASVQVTQGANNVVFIRLSNSLLFGGDSAVILPDAMYVMEYLGDCFLEVESEIYNLRCIGHTADIPDSGTDDWELSSSRAGRVVSYFEKGRGFPMQKLMAVSYGRAFPIADNADPVARTANRRVDIIVVGNSDNQEVLSAALTEAAAVYFPGDDQQFAPGDTAGLPGGAADSIDPTGEADMGLQPPADSVPEEGAGGEAGQGGDEQEAV